MAASATPTGASGAKMAHRFVSRQAAVAVPLYSLVLRYGLHLVGGGVGVLRPWARWLCRWGSPCWGWQRKAASSQNCPQRAPVLPVLTSSASSSVRTFGMQISSQKPAWTKSFTLAPSLFPPQNKILSKSISQNYLHCWAAPPPQTPKHRPDTGSAR